MWYRRLIYGALLAGVLLFQITNENYLACFLLGRMLQSLFRALHLTIVNRLCGVAFCALEVAVVLSLFMNLWHMVSPSTAPADATTEGLRGLVYNVAPALLGFLN